MKQPEEATAQLVAECFAETMHDEISFNAGGALKADANSNLAITEVHNHVREGLSESWFWVKTSDGRKWGVLVREVAGLDRD
jgi:hypothetical protein